MKLQSVILGAASVFVISLSGCGGGGSSGHTGPVTSTDSFPVAAAYASLEAAGYSKNFTVSTTGTATCSGSGNITVGAVSTSTTFNITPANTVAALSGVETYTINLTNCSPATSSFTQTTYANPSNYFPLGASATGIYAAYLTAAVIPTAVTVGSTGIVGTVSLFTDSTETSSTGHEDVTYTVTADTASTAMFNIIYKTYDATSTLTSTEADEWRMTAVGALTPVKLIIAYTSGLNETWTYN
jgi:hypothetical protein